jgi:hypothetical protein
MVHPGTLFIGDSGAFLCIPMKIGVKSEHPRPAAEPRRRPRGRARAARPPRRLGVDAKVITRCYSSERAQQLRSCVSLSAFSGDGHVMALTPRANSSPGAASTARRRLWGLLFVCCLYSVDVMQNCEGSLS